MILALVACLTGCALLCVARTEAQELAGATLLLTSPFLLILEAMI